MHARPTQLALGAIALWASCAGLGVSLAHVPPFLLTGVTLLLGSLLSVPIAARAGRWSDLRPPLPALVVGVYGLFGYHFLLFLGLRSAPPVEANLINYLWPLLIVVLAPVIVPDARLRARHVLAALVGFAGAAWAMLGGSAHARGFHRGYLLTLGAAFVWSTYSLATQRLRAVPTTAIGPIAAVSGALALVCHVLLEPHVSLSTRDGILLAVMGLGPLGAAFYLWDAALKRGEAARIGVLSFITPLLSTSLLLLIRHERPGVHVLGAAMLIVGAAAVGVRGSSAEGGVGSRSS